MEFFVTLFLKRLQKKAHEADITYGGFCYLVIVNQNIEGDVYCSDNILLRSIEDSPH